MKNIHYSNINDIQLSSKDMVKSHDNINVWKAVVNNKKLIIREQLLGCEKKINERYKFFESNYNSLDLVKPVGDLVIDRNKDRLIGCYGNNVIVKQIKKRLFQNQKKCPYCQINEANTLDHYFDKSTYPEYSIFTYNLVPCCSQCNTTKGTRMFSTNGTRQFIHFYFDNLPTTQFLFIRFVVEPYTNVPSFNIFMDFVHPYNEIEQIIKGHFDELEIIKRYSGIIEEKVSVFINHCGLSSRSGTALEEFREMTHNNYIALVEQYGINHWEACIYEGFLNSENFIEKYYKNTYTNM